MSTQAAVLAKTGTETGQNQRPGQFPRIWSDDRAGRDHGLFPVHDPRHVVQAAQPDQSGSPEQLCDYHGAGDAAGHRGRATLIFRWVRWLALSALWLR